MVQRLSNAPPKGTSDWLPEEFAIRKYIFDAWRRVNCQFGFQEYMTPIFELADIYRAKSGEDVGGKELLVVTDRGGRDLAIRPEMTPSVTRMVTRFYRQTQKPLRLFSIANFWRNERPQRGRNREFWQLNSDIFGSTSINADIEILQLALHLMLAFQPPAGAFTLFINHRHLIDTVLQTIAGVPDEANVQTVRVLDKYGKLPQEAFLASLNKLGLSQQTADLLLQFMQSQSAEALLENFPRLKEDAGYLETSRIFQALQATGFGDWIRFKPSLIRGFDYYDGMVFEVFDNNPENNRSMFGGGRYNGLAHLFGGEDIPALGFAPGDETTRLFLESWNLVPEHLSQNRTIYLPLLDDSLADAAIALASELRQAGLYIEQGLEAQSFRAALKTADRKGAAYVILLGTDEVSQGMVSLKDMRTGDQERLTKSDLIKKLQDSALTPWPPLPFEMGEGESRSDGGEGR